MLLGMQSGESEDAQQTPVTTLDSASGLSHLAGFLQKFVLYWDAGTVVRLLGEAFFKGCRTINRMLRILQVVNSGRDKVALLPVFQIFPWIY